MGTTMEDAADEARAQAGELGSRFRRARAQAEQLAEFHTAPVEPWVRTHGAASAWALTTAPDELDAAHRALIQARADATARVSAAEQRLAALTTSTVPTPGSRAFRELETQVAQAEEQVEAARFFETTLSHLLHDLPVGDVADLRAAAEQGRDRLLRGLAIVGAEHTARDPALLQDLRHCRELARRVLQRFDAAAAAREKVEAIVGPTTGTVVTFADRAALETLARGDATPTIDWSIG